MKEVVLHHRYMYYIYQLVDGMIGVIKCMFLSVPQVMQEVGNKYFTNNVDGWSAGTKPF